MPYRLNAASPANLLLGSVPPKDAPRKAAPLGEAVTAELGLHSEQRSRDQGDHAESAKRDVEPKPHGAHDRVAAMFLRLRRRRRYSPQEVESMRDSLRAINMPLGAGQYPREVADDIDAQLADHVRRGTDPEQLAKLAAGIQSRYRITS